MFSGNTVKSRDRDKGKELADNKMPDNEGELRRSQVSEKQACEK